MANAVYEVYRPIRIGPCSRCGRVKKRGNKPLALTHFDTGLNKHVCKKCADTLRHLYRMYRMVNG